MERMKQPPWTSSPWQDEAHAHTHTHTQHSVRSIYSRQRDADGRGIYGHRRNYRQHTEQYCGVQAKGTFRRPAAEFFGLGVGVYRRWERLQLLLAVSNRRWWRYYRECGQTRCDLRNRTFSLLVESSIISTISTIYLIQKQQNVYTHIHRLIGRAERPRVGFDSANFVFFFFFYVNSLSAKHSRFFSNVILFIYPSVK